MCITSIKVNISQLTKTIKLSFATILYTFVENIAPHLTWFNQEQVKPD